ncbi:hypothetical protein D018_3169B, partial [Vibrio parahaemolyticus VP2007-007]
ILEFGYT